MQVLEGKFQNGSYLKSGLTPLALASVVHITSNLIYPFIKVWSFLPLKCKCCVWPSFSSRLMREVKICV